MIIYLKDTMQNKKLSELPGILFIENHQPVGFIKNN